MSSDALDPTPMLAGPAPVPPAAKSEPEKSKSKPPSKDSDSTASSAPPAKKPRKKYVITKHRENWTDEEHQLFLDALKKYGRSWKQIEGHVRSKNVIQIRSHAQKYFIKVQKNNTGEHIPPPRPKRKQNQLNGATSSPLQTQPVMRPNQAPVAVPLSPSMSPAMSPHLHQHAMAFALAAQHPMAAHMQMPPHLYSLHALGLHAQTAQYLGYRHPMQAIRPGQPNQPQPPRSAAKAISPRLVDPKDLAKSLVPQQEQHLQRQHRRREQMRLHQERHRQQQIQQQREKQEQSLQQQQQDKLQQQQQQLKQTQQPHFDVALTVSKGESSAFAVVPLGPSPSQPLSRTSSEHQRIFEATVQEDIRMDPVPVLAPKAPDPLPSRQSDNTIDSFGDARTSGNEQDSFLVPQAQTARANMPLSSPNAGSAAMAATAAAASAAAAVSGEPVATSPNFTKIYGFFAAMFDPTGAPNVSNLIRISALSALDWEIIKLLVNNLEVNVDSSAFRQQLADTYGQQQMRLQGQQQPQQQDQE